MRELKGSMKDVGAHQGLLVSWSGFKRTVVAERRRHFFEVRLWNADDLVAAVFEHYEQFPAELRAELPLRRVWTPVQEEM